jgi:hypothetical protein
MKGVASDRYLVLLAVAALLILLWFYSIADPCRFAAIAITECIVRDGRVIITNGDVITRLSALFFLMGSFGFVCALLEASRAPWSFAGIAAAGATIAFAAHQTLNFSIFMDASIEAFDVVVWMSAVIVAGLAAKVGAGIAAMTAAE